METKIKDISKKFIVEAYQRQVREAIDHILSLETKTSTLMREYIKGLEENIRLAPYNLGYLTPIIEIKKKK